jgi:hypothetical protein
MTLGSILAREGTPPEHLQVTATVTLETSGDADDRLQPARGALKLL